MNKYYITTAIPYVNAAPHIGHALEFVQADAVARYRKLLGDDTLLLSGADENALKNVRAAEAAGKPVGELVDQNAKLFQHLAKSLHVHFDVFQRGSDHKKHFPACQKLWRLCQENGDIYKKEYEGLYCVGCEAFYTPDELNENLECFEHPGKKLEKVRESNYFFRLSAYQEQLSGLISSDTIKIVPLSRKNEVLGFLKQPLRDISISRTNERAKNWGVPVPGDESQRMYVWFDALNIYQSGVGFGWDEKEYRKWWPADVHAIGKGIIRFHAVYWPAFLLSAGLPLPKNLFVHSYITVEGSKMSKSVGNVIDPFKTIAKWGADSLRFYLLREVSPFEDGDYSETRMDEIYGSELANELGNLILRITTLAQKDAIEVPEKQDKPALDETYRRHFEHFEFNLAIEQVWTKVKELNRGIDVFVPWKKSPSERREFLVASLETIRSIAYHLLPVMPETSTVILKTVTGKIVKPAPLFPKT